VEYLYNARSEPIDMSALYTDLKDLGNLIHIKLKGKKKTTIVSIDVARGINKKTRKNKTSNSKGNLKTRVSFKRRPKQRRFKNPFFLSIK
jgi:hypothetical protein